MANLTKLIPLAKNQYYQTVYQKSKIFLHHTAGGSAMSAIGHWASNPEHIATPYVIERSGDIYECYDPKYWAYHLGVKGRTDLERASIGIEIVSFGNLTKKNEKYLAWTGREINPEQVSEVNDFRGIKYFQSYTLEQIASLKELLLYLTKTFAIPRRVNVTDQPFWEYRDPRTLPPGIWSHTTVRKDKVDIFPQKELIGMLSTL